MYKLLLSLIIVLSSYCYAEENITISSDLFVADKEKQLITFSGKNVVIIFSDIVLKTKKVQIKLDSKDAIERIIIPEKFILEKSANKTIVVGNSADYDNKKEKLTITGNVKVKQSGKIIECNSLIYYTKLQEIR